MNVLFSTYMAGEAKLVPGSLLPPPPEYNGSIGVPKVNCNPPNLASCSFPYSIEKIKEAEQQGASKKTEPEGEDYLNYIKGPFMKANNVYGTYGKMQPPAPGPKGYQSEVGFHQYPSLNPAVQYN